MVEGLSIYGAGRFIEAINIQRFVLATLEGNDDVYLLSSSPYVNTAIVTGLGSDRVFLTPTTVPAVHAPTGLGHSGLVKHKLVAGPQSWLDNLPNLDGVHTYITDGNVFNVETKGPVRPTSTFARLGNSIVLENPSQPGAHAVPLIHKQLVYTLSLSKQASPRACIEVGFSCCRSASILNFILTPSPPLISPSPTRRCFHATHRQAVMHC